MTNTFHVIKDPVHGTMQFPSIENSWVKPFIDNPNFQRLRHIKQLGLGDFIFPGASHTRFNHSLGCCYVGSQIAQKIGLADEERQLVIIACLLHDIGHGPFSHAFEGLFQKKIIRHEDWTPFLLADFSSHDFFTHYNEENARYPLTEEKFTTIASMIMHQPIERRVLADIVSSQLDADRLDYLLRDSHFCGVRYGEFDFRWMLHCLAIVNSPEGERLGVTHKGIGVVEHYLMARRLMMRNIYHLQKKLALEFLLVKLLTTLAANLADDSNFATIRATRLGKFLIAANEFIEEKNSQNFVQHKSQFIEENCKAYKKLCDFDVFMLINQLSESENTHPAVKIAQRLQYRIMPKIVRLDYLPFADGANHLNLKEMEMEIKEFKTAHQQDLQDWQLVLIRTPHQSYSDEADPIWVINDQNIIEPIGNFSFMLSAIADKFEQGAFLCIDQAIAKNKRVKQLVDRLQTEVIPS